MFGVRPASSRCWPRRSPAAACSPACWPACSASAAAAIIVPVLYEVFRALGVPEDVRMQLCIGTSLAIIVPTTFRSYFAHRAEGAA